MSQLPNSLEEAIEQAKQATKAALADDYKLIQVELVFPEIELQAQSIAQEFIPAIEEPNHQLVVLFPDTGAAALARRDWGETSFRVTDLGTSRSPVETRLEPEDQQFLVVSPSAVEVAQVEKLYQLAGDRPVILLNPKLEDLAIIGIGYAARQLRERFIKTIESCYYLKALEGAALRRCYPSMWEVWLEIDGQYQLITEQPTKPVGDELDLILAQVTQESDESVAQPVQRPKKGVLSGLQNFIRALSR
ncbi:putative adenylate kinase 5, chloroplastic [Planktothrix tepida]|uniref:DUF1995 domain-containing protein n=2 Tax=Planktothrix TaxID=54304 RepID=A0A1J1LN20_9CYAN|nr:MULTISPECIES: DUF1995 family protein [Planktothrix]CAD5942555.1 putative adenylate kinase 5, chloroplastic [Planktothrix tepida]CAD5968909.1 putative adenylate kinase 5, chloroplastic [Planktothrix pseudagardhii]CUR33017.1 conserved hypothetical protein [Planktothrix tepida PCC 9214]